MKDYLQYLIDEGFVDIRFWYNEDDLIDGRISTLKGYEPLYLEAEDEDYKGTLLLWRGNGRCYTYKTTRQFFAKYGKMCKSENQALLQSNQWIREAKEIVRTYN
jgi:hypothetical protein